MTLTAKRVYSILAIILLTTVPAIEAQQPSKVSRIGVLFGSAPEAEKTRLAAFQQRLRDLGYNEGKNIFMEYRYAEGKLDRSPNLVAELLRLKVDVLVVTYLPGTRAAKEATKTIPIVMLSFVDPVAAGIVDSLAKPGGNITGLATLRRDLSGKRLELLKEAVPGRSRVGVLWDANAPGPAIAYKEYEAAAHVLNLQLQTMEARGPTPDLEGAFQVASKARANALIIVSNPVVNPHRERIAQLAIKNRLPSLGEGAEMVEAGGMMSYAANDVEQFRRAAVYVDKILRGAKPADLPVEQPTKFEFVINLKTANMLKLTIPQSVLFRADRVIK